MKRLLLMDEHNYDDALNEIRRIAVRGIISVDRNLLFVEDKFGALKLPGGGQEAGENNFQTLIREVREETGYNVIPDSIRPFGYIEEKRISAHEEMIWHQFNYLYFCNVENGHGVCEYSDNEKKIGLHLKVCKLDDAILINKKVMDSVEQKAWYPWYRREYNTLLLLHSVQTSLKPKI